MRKKVVLMLLTLICFSGIAFATSTPLRFCLWPGLAYPANENLYGLNIGIGNGSKVNQTIAGLDLALLFSQADAEGVQISIFNMGDNSDALQLGLINLVKNFNGAQISVYNDATNSSFFQLGIINKSQASKGFQLGLINVMENGIMPVCPLINFNFK